jgi:hypothetical protein
MKERSGEGREFGCRGKEKETKWFAFSHISQGINSRPFDQLVFPCAKEISDIFMTNVQSSTSVPALLSDESQFAHRQLLQK